MFKPNSYVTGLLAIVLTTMSSTALSGKTGGKGGGKGTVVPYELGLTALQDVTGKTDATLEVLGVEPGFSAPTQAKHIQVKSLDSNGDTIWTRNTRNVALDPADSGTSSTADIEYDALDVGKPLKTRVQIQNAETGNTEVLDAEMIVQRRPDLSVGEITTAEQINPGIITNISVEIGEEKPNREPPLTVD